MISTMRVSNRRVSTLAIHFRRGILKNGRSGGMCFAICTALQGYLSFLGYETEIVEGEVGDANHIWLRLPDGNILDPTADQFARPSGKSMPEVYIGVLPQWYQQIGKAQKR